VAQQRHGHAWCDAGAFQGVGVEVLSDCRVVRLPFPLLLLLLRLMMMMMMMMLWKSDPTTTPLSREPLSGPHRSTPAPSKACPPV